MSMGGNSERGQLRPCSQCCLLVWSTGRDMVVRMSLMADRQAFCVVAPGGDRDRVRHRHEPGHEPCLGHSRTRRLYRHEPCGWNGLRHHAGYSGQLRASNAACGRSRGAVPRRAMSSCASRTGRSRCRERSHHTGKQKMRAPHRGL